MTDVIVVAVITAVVGPGALVLLTRVLNRSSAIANAAHAVTASGMQLLDQVQEERDTLKADVVVLRRDLRSLVAIGYSLLSRLGALGVDVSPEKQVVDAINERH